MHAASADHRRSVLLILLAALFWSLGGVLIQYVQWNPFAIGAVRSAFAAATLAVLVRRFRFSRSPALWLGAAAYAGTVLCLAFAYKHTSAANAITLQYTAPVWVALLGWPLLRERPRGADIVTLAAVAAGIALFFRDAPDALTGRSLRGDLVALASGVCYAGIVLSLRLQRGDDGARFETVLAGNVLAALAAGPFCFTSIGGTPPPGPGGWAALVALGVVQLGIPYWLYARALRHVSAVEGATLPLAEPVLVPVWVFLFLGRPPGPWALAGMVVVLGAVTARAWWGIARPAAPATAR